MLDSPDEALKQTLTVPRARIAVRNIQSLIGYFDLDPNRVLDTILDVFVANVQYHWRFFLSVLAESGWGPAGGWTGVCPIQDITVENAASLIDEADGVGNGILAQILGFKFQFYQSKETREDAPDELYLVAALLLKNGFVRLMDIFPHVS